jgi:hypothetical protein
MSEGAGKGDDYRKVDAHKFAESYTRIFGERDFMDFHKDKNPFNVSTKVNENDSTQIDVSFQLPIQTLENELLEQLLIKRLEGEK